MLVGKALVPWALGFEMANCHHHHPSALASLSMVPSIDTRAALALLALLGETSSPPRPIAICCVGAGVAPGFRDGMLLHRGSNLLGFRDSSKLLRGSWNFLHTG